jgi:hypothetical protein
MQTDIFSTCGLITISLLNLGKILRYSSSFVKLVKANVNVNEYLVMNKDINGIKG